MSRLDKFLLSENRMTSRNITGQWIGDSDISDHCSVWLVGAVANRGPNPSNSTTVVWNMKKPSKDLLKSVGAPFR